MLSLSLEEMAAEEEPVRITKALTLHRLQKPFVSAEVANTNGFATCARNSDRTKQGLNPKLAWNTESKTFVAN
ncbi:hypothetical protein RHMOL_Rhmol03G0212400 [Rhododendron molle]|uniref:Uncharacterized protein n=1 Tax=Rhododendron molle TaxID=49168 RepID=A0ACC0PJ45_RHOML|nr:hypothetical protein RHMOL_Rhmol03G0212400 [Rhododendron molle]